MRKVFYIILLLSISFFGGCAKSLIKLVVNDDTNSYNMFGKYSAREFFVDVNVSDSLTLLWEQSAYGSFTNSSAVYTDSVVIVSDLGGRIHCFDIRNGKQVGVLKSKGTVYSTPIINKRKLIYALVDNKDDETELIIYDFFQGKELFTTDIKGRVLSQMLMDGDDIILATEDGSVKKISSRGKIIWEYESSAKLSCNAAMINKTILIGNVEGEIIAINSETGSKLFKKKIGKPFFSGITIDGSSAFIGDNSGILYSFEISNGSINWKFETSSRILMNPAVDDKNVYIGNLSGELFSFNKLTGTMNWKSYLDGILNSTPLITKNRIIITNLFKSFSILNKEDGTTKKTYDLDGRGKFSPVLIDNKLIIGYDDGIVRAYEFVY